MNVDITFLPSGRTVTVRAGTSVLDASRKAGVPIRTRCGGKAACLMCKVVTNGVGLTSLSEIERRKIGELERQGIRLSCQTRITGRATVEVPEDPLKAAVRKQLMRQAEEDDLW